MVLSSVWKGWEMQIFGCFFFLFFSLSLFPQHLFVPGVFFPFSVLMGPWPTSSQSVKRPCPTCTPTQRRALTACSPCCRQQYSAVRRFTMRWGGVSLHTHARVNLRAKVLRRSWSCSRRGGFLAIAKHQKADICHTGQQRKRRRAIILLDTLCIFLMLHFLPIWYFNKVKTGTICKYDRISLRQEGRPEI